VTEFAADFTGADIRFSPNFGERRDGKKADIVLLHYTGMETATAALDWLCNPQSEVSCHYLVHENGGVVQMVPERCRAWHAGMGYWAGETDINSRSIGIEIVNQGHAFGYPEFPDAQIASVVELCRDIVDRHSIRPERILAHSDTAPGRKADPGEKFPWSFLYSEGIGHLVEPTPIRGGRFFVLGDCGQPVEALQSMFAYYGYGIEITGNFDEETRAVTEAFQRHFRPERVDGVADISTIETLHRLNAALPADLDAENS
jgi:N-acetylmuramoyl-L-alanine amidase